MDILTNEMTNNASFKLNNVTYQNNLTEEALDKSDEIELYKAVSLALNEWKNSVANFETAQEPDLVDYYTYKIKACEIRYQYLLKEIKKYNSKKL